MPDPRERPKEGGVESWCTDIDQAPKDESVLISTDGDHVGEARLDFDAYEEIWEWVWANGDPVHVKHVVRAWMALPRPFAPAAPQE